MDLIPTTPQTSALGGVSSNRVTLVVAPHAGMPLMVESAARLALNGSVRVLDCGNRFNVYPVAQAVRRLTSRLEETLSHISLSRAFPCYQVLTLLEETSARPVATLVLDLLATFLDENVTFEESRRLLQLGIGHLERISRNAPVVVSVKPLLSLSADRKPLLEMLKEAAAETVQFEAPHLQQPSSGLPLFPGI
jgi:hypothetical protein